MAKSIWTGPGGQRRVVVAEDLTDAKSFKIIDNSQRLEGDRVPTRKWDGFCDECETDLRGKGITETRPSGLVLCEKCIEGVQRRQQCR